ncbi:hypothetical protein ILYODFUR_032777 [Ilyodon furcidens]|uniref:Uncharacterized protein n=1 Tax=Ilyodon furcidens TaxID=33524 RepID=A0ABV0TRP1_9TELE
MQLRQIPDSSELPGATPPGGQPSPDTHEEYLHGGGAQPGSQAEEAPLIPGTQNTTHPAKPHCSRGAGREEESWQQLFLFSELTLIFLTNSSTPHTSSLRSTLSACLTSTCPTLICLCSLLHPPLQGQRQGSSNRETEKEA